MKNIKKNLIVFFFLGILLFLLPVVTVDMNTSLDLTLPIISSDIIIHSVECALDMIQTMDGGLVILIDTSDDVILAKLDSQGEVQWSRSYGMISSSYSNNGKNILIQTMDGGFAFTGQINYTLGLIKTDSEGTVEWVQMFDREEWIEVYSLIQTSDRGYAVATNRKLLKLDESGLLLWEMNYEHLLNGERVFVIQTTDGGYNLAGSFYSSQSSWNMKILKLDSQGQLEWSKNYGGEYEEQVFAFIQTADNHFLLGGIYWEYNLHKVPQAFLLKIDQDGIMIWNQKYGDGKTYSGGGVSRWVGDLVSTLDGGYAFVDFDRLIKVNSNGALQWEKQYGGIRDEVLLAIVQDNEGNFILAGTTYWGCCVYPEGVNSEDVSWYDSRDAWIVKADSSGVIMWQIALDGLKDEEWAKKVIETDDNGFVLAGITNSFGAGQADMWIVKTNATGSMEWNKTYGGVLDEGVESIIPTKDGGFALIGFTSSFGNGETDIWLVKTDASGSMEWNKTFGGPAKDWGIEIVQVSDGGFVLAGVKESSEKWFNWVIKVDNQGVIDWEQTYSRERDVRRRDMKELINFIQTTDNGFALASCNELIKMDTTGTVQWKTSVDGIHIITNLMQTSDNNYILGGVSMDWSFPKDGYLVKMNEEGVVQWIQVIEGLPVKDVVQTADDGFSIWIDPTDSWESKPTMIMKTGTNGVQQWNHTFDFQTIGTDLILTGDGKLVVTGSKVFTGIEIGVSYDMWLAKLDEVCTLLWESTHGITSGNISSNLAINLDYTAPSTTPTSPSTTPGLDVFSFLIVMIVVSNWIRRKKNN